MNSYRKNFTLLL